MQFRQLISLWFSYERSHIHTCPLILLFAPNESKSNDVRLIPRVIAFPLQEVMPTHSQSNSKIAQMAIEMFFIYLMRRSPTLSCQKFTKQNSLDVYSEEEMYVCSNIVIAFAFNIHSIAVTVDADTWICVCTLRLPASRTKKSVKLHISVGRSVGGTSYWQSMQRYSHSCRLQSIIRWNT